MASEAPGAPASDTAASNPASHTGADGHRPQGFLALALGSIGVVFGDIGTSPLYAMREALAHAKSGGTTEMAVMGVVSLVIWAMFLVVTVKYVLLLMRADNKGEGGTLALMALARRTLTKTTGKRSAAVFFLGVVGAALFYGDGIITPAISVLSAMEGLRDAPGMGARVEPYILPISAGILVALFMVQSRGTHRVAAFFGPITLLWFIVLGGMGLFHLKDDLSIFWAINPWYGARFLWENGFLGFVILGSVFLVVTGAEALYADMVISAKGRSAPPGWW
ncbi:KUP/HAK/KT family potassium transporter, partial [Brevundimonas sp.]|uniref:KUP/HAK/KT family potassium transporter n=1 Tax=Brevundimonas sp. TaxID=1871086 RepID=UPI003A0FE5F3